MNIKKKLSTILALVMISAFTVSVAKVFVPMNNILAYAEDTKKKTDTSTDTTMTVDEVIKNYHNNPAVSQYLTTDDGDSTYDKTLEVDGVKYHYKSSDASKIQEAGATAKKSYDITNSTEVEETRQGIKKLDSEIGNYAGGNGLGLSADTSTAVRLMSGFTGVIRTLLGILVIAVSIGMTVFSAFDLCYIAFPVFRNKCEDAKQNGGMLASNKKSANGESKLRFVSDDAQYAVVAADTVQSGKNPFVIYFGKRLVSYLVLAILIFILLTGKITVFTTIAVNLVSGLIDIISGI